MELMAWLLPPTEVPTLTMRPEEAMAWLPLPKPAMALTAGGLFGEGVATLEVKAGSRFRAGGSAMESVVGVLAAMLREKCWL